jgi:hypothetical protein
MSDDYIDDFDSDWLSRIGADEYKDESDEETISIDNTIRRDISDTRFVFEPDYVGFYDNIRPLVQNSMRHRISDDINITYIDGNGTQRVLNNENQSNLTREIRESLFSQLHHHIINIFSNPDIPIHEVRLTLDELVAFGVLSDYTIYETPDTMSTRIKLEKDNMQVSFDISFNLRMRRGY